MAFFISYFTKFGIESSAAIPRRPPPEDELENALHIPTPISRIFGTFRTALPVETNLSILLASRSIVGA
jgi:hypothetical protein